MIAHFLKDGDERLDKLADFEVQTINQDGEVVDINWRENTTFNFILDSFKYRHRQGIEASILDYGDELQATVTPNAKSVKHHYCVMMIED